MAPQQIVGGSPWCPAWLKPSAATDLRLILAGARQTMRTELARPVSGTDIRRWARGRGLFASLDAHGFLALSRRPGIARQLLALDAALGDHTDHLGGLLGYPLCCRRAVRRRGEAEIDALAAAAAGRRHIGQFHAISPAGYADGQALISHVPCAPSCRASLDMAESVASWARRTITVSFRGTVLSCGLKEASDADRHRHPLPQ